MSLMTDAPPAQKHADIFVGDSEMARLMRAHDWAATPLGPPERWPDTLKVALRILLTSRFEMWVGWGPDVHFFYNDAYRPTLALKHPNALARPTRLLWAEIWDDIKGRIAAVYEDGAATWDEALLLLVERAGYREETYHTFAYSPLIGDAARVEGLFCAVTEVTDRVISERRLATLRELARGLSAAHTRPAVLEATAAALGGATRDLTFSALYLFDQAGVARLATTAGVPHATPLTPAQADADSLWQPRRIAAGESPYVVPLGAGLPVPVGAWDAPTGQALVIPVRRKGEATPAGFLACGLNPYRPLDPDYVAFLELLAGQIGAGIAGAEAFDARTAERDRLRALFQQSPSFMCVLRGPEHVFELANETYEKLVGKRDLEGKAVREAFPELAGQGFFELLDQVYRSGEPYVGQGLEIQLAQEAAAPPVTRYLDFVYQPVTAASGARSGIFVVGHDVTEATVATRNLQRTQQWLQEGLEAGRMVAVEWDLPSRTVKYSSNAPEVLGHGDSGDEVGWGSIHPDDRAGLRAAIDASAANGAPFRHLTRRVRPDNGRLIWTDIRGKVSHDAQGNPAAMRGIVIDVTERVEAERALQEANRRKDEFLAMLAHELRNPLAPVATAAEILHMPGTDAPRARRAAEIIGRQVRHMVHLVDDLLDVSRVTRGLVELDKARVDLKDVLHHAVEQAKPVIEGRGHLLAQRLQPGPIHVAADRTRLVQVLVNLLNNAAKYTPPGGEIGVGLESSPTEVRIRVSDNGTGIPESLLPHVFELFTQGERTPDRAQGGLGIGLALVRSIVELHGGTVRAASAGPGRGSSFVVTLPLAQESADDGQGDGHRTHAGRKRALRVLVVDDNADAAELLAALLEAEGHTVAVANEGAGAQAVAGGFAPDVCILDIGLPDITGHELARRLAPQLPGCMFIALSGYGQPHDRELSLAAGFHLHLVKPAPTQELLDALAAAG